MEKNANYALVGLSTLILTIGLVIFFAWLARISFTHEYDIYDVLFQGPVRGLSQGGEVHFNGIKVGEVTRIKLNDLNTSQVIARVRVDANVPIRSDSYGTLDASVFYQVNERLSLGFEGTNLTDSTYRQLMQQHTGLMGRAWFASGPRYAVKMRYSF